jgi:hypothetical protein
MSGFFFGGIMKLNVLNTAPVLGKFSKAVDGSRSLNFGQSGGHNCDISCIHHPKNRAADATRQCYALNTELRFDRKQLLNKLKRHEHADPALLAKRALNELRCLQDVWPVPWFRISTNGSVPQPEDCTPDFVKALKDLLEYCEERDIPVHFPVESKRKRIYYRKILKHRAVVRQSCQSITEFISSPGAVSIVAGVSTMSRWDRIVEAKRLAALRTAETGRKAIVCPAVASRYIEFETRRRAGDKKAHLAKGSPKSKCGRCVACAVPDFDVVYPLH